MTTTWPNKSPEPTAVGPCSSAFAVHVVGRRWLSFLREASLHLWTYTATHLRLRPQSSSRQPYCQCATSSQKRITTWIYSRRIIARPATRFPLADSQKRLVT